MSIVNRHDKLNNIDMAEIINLSADAIISLDESQNVVLFNAAAEKIFGYSAAEIIGQSLNILLPATIQNQHAGYIESFREANKDARPMGSKSDLCGIAKSGETIPLDITIQKHPKGGTCSYTAICRDIRNRIKQESLVKENEAKFRTVFNASQQYTILMNGKGEVLEFNNTLNQFIEAEAQQYIGKKIWECSFWAKEQDSLIVQNAIVNMTSGDRLSLVASIVGKKSQKRVLDMALAIIPLGEGEPSLIVLEGKDITGILNTNKALLESEIRLTSAQKIAHLGNWQWNITTNELRWSDEIYRIFGLKPNEFEANYEAFLAVVHPEDREHVEKAVVGALSEDKPYRIIHRILLHDGTEKIVEERGEIIRMEDGTPLQMNGIVQDITNNWHREQELRLAKQRAEEANIAKAQFLSTVSHELRTPLNAIIGFSSMIAEEQLGSLNIPTYTEYAKDINNSGHELLEMIKSILDITSFELGSISLKPSHFSAKALLENSLSRVTKKAEKKNIKIETKIDTGIPELFLDENHTQQMLIHLIDNAIKFSAQNDTVKVNLNYLNNEFVIDVIDQGIGIDETDMESIFDLFVQKDMNLNRIYGGVGLGLTIVKNLAELQGARVQVKSIRNQGSCFSLYFSREKINAQYHH